MMAFSRGLGACFFQEEIVLARRVRGSVFPKALVFALPSAIVAVVLQLFIKGYGGQLGEDAQTNQIWASFNYVLGVLLVFRTNQAYARFWEGATLLQQARGEWFNAASSLFAFCTTDESRQKEVMLLHQQLVRLVSMLYCAALQQVSIVSDSNLEIIDPDGLDPDSLAFLARSSDRCEVILQWLQRLIIINMHSGVVNVPPPILSRVFQELSRGVVNTQNCRKIAEIPFPFPYTQMIIVMLLIQTVLTPILASVTSEQAWWAGCLTFTTLLALWCMNFIAGEIEHPFGEDFNDLPIAEMCRDMNRSLRTLLRPQAQTPPKFHMHGDTQWQCSFVNCEDCNYTTKQRALVKGFVKSRSQMFRRNTIARLSVGQISNSATSATSAATASAGGPGQMGRKSRQSPYAHVDKVRSRTSFACSDQGDDSDWMKDVAARVSRFGPLIGSRDLQDADSVSNWSSGPSTSRPPAIPEQREQWQASRKEVVEEADGDSEDLSRISAL